MKNIVLKFGLIGILLASTSHIVWGQFKSTAITHSEEEPFPRFAYTTSFGFSTNGPVYTSEFKLVDELGFEFDIMSLLKNEQVREEIGLTDEQLQKMRAIKSEVDENMGDIISTLASEDQRNQVKNRILGAEEILHNMLEPEQATRLAQLRNQMGIERFGLVPYLNRKSMLSSMGLSAKEIEDFQTASKKRLEKFNAEQESLNHKLNEQLLAELPKTERNRLSKLVGETHLKKILRQPLFVNEPTSLVKLEKKALKQIDVIKAERLQTLLEISEEQREDILAALKEYHDKVAAKHEQLGQSDYKQSIKQRAKLLKEFVAKMEWEFEKELALILNTKQMTRLLGLVVEYEAQTSGTVGAIATGQVAHQLDLNPSVSERLYEKGLELQEIREAELNELKQKLRESVLKLYGPKYSASASELFGKPSQIKKR